MVVSVVPESNQRTPFFVGKGPVYDRSFALIRVFVIIKLGREAALTKDIVLELTLLAHFKNVKRKYFPEKLYYFQNWGTG